MRIRLYKPAVIFLSRCAPENIFLVLASWLTTLYMLVVFPLTDYAHGTERFLHVIDYGMTSMDKPGRMPVGFLELVKQSQPKMLVRKYGNQTRLWDDELDITPYFSDKKPVKNFRGKRKTVTEWVSRVGSLSSPYERTVSFVTNKNPAMYSVIGYIPFIIPAIIGLMVEAQPIIILYASILFNSILSILLGYYVIRITPVLKWFYVFLLLLPSVCMNRALVMPDAVNLGLCLLIVSVVMRLKVDAQPLTLKRKFGLVALSTLVGLIKISYFLVPAVGLLIPSVCFRSNTKKMLWVGAAVLASVGAAIAWSMHALPTTHVVIPSISHGKFALSEVLTGVVSLPFSMHQWFGWLNNIFFWNISSATLHDLTGIILIMTGTLCLLALTFFPYRDSAAFTLTRLERWICGIIFLVTMLIIITVVSLQTRTITAQGRYFIPILPLLSTMLYHPAIVARIARFIAPCVVWISACCLGIMHYYMLTHF